MTPLGNTRQYGKDAGPGQASVLANMSEVYCGSGVVGHWTQIFSVLVRVVVRPIFRGCPLLSRCQRWRRRSTGAAWLLPGLRIRVPSAASVPRSASQKPGEARRMPASFDLPASRRHPELFAELGGLLPPLRCAAAGSPISPRSSRGKLPTLRKSADRQPFPVSPVSWCPA